MSEERSWRDTPQARAVHDALASRGFDYLTHRQVDAVLNGLLTTGFLLDAALDRPGELPHGE